MMLLLLSGITTSVQYATWQAFSILITIVSISTIESHAWITLEINFLFVPIWNVQFFETYFPIGNESLEPNYM